MQIVEQAQIALPVERIEPGLACRGQLGVEVGSNAGLHWPYHQGGGDSSKVGGQPGQQHLGVAGLSERRREPLQLRAQRPGPVPVDDAAEGLQRAAGPAGGYAHLAHGVWLITADPRVITGDCGHLVAHVGEHHLACGRMPGQRRWFRRGPGGSQALP